MKNRTTFLAAGLVLLVASAALAQSLREWRRLAQQMVDEEIVAAGVTNELVIRSMRDTPRHEFMPSKQRPYAYLDMALAIGHGQTISPPFVVAYMTQEIDPQPEDKVLEIGTGSGYQAAILSPLVREVYTIEIVDVLGRRAERTLKKLKYDNVSVRVGDGYLGWPEAAPFDKIIVTCSPEKVPQPLVDQLRDGGLMIVPVGERYQQNLYLFRKQDGKLESEALRATLFVPMTGEAESQRRVMPDALRPEVANGGFEESADGGKSPTGWHYQRQLTLMTDRAAAPEGRRFVTFRNEEPGRGCRALQGFAIDGRKISKLRVSCSVRAKNIRSGTKPDDWPRIVVTFYDDRRAVIGEARTGPFFGTFDWQEETAELPVPLKAREAIVRIGLLGAVGELSMDRLRLTVAN